MGRPLAVLLRAGSAALLAVLVGNCTLPAAAVDPNATEYTPENVCAISAKKVCEARRPCCDASGYGYGAELCESDNLSQCLADLADYKAGQALFKPEKLDACLKQTAAYFSTCSTFALDDYFKDNACTFTPFQGKRGEGAPCDRDTQCAPPETPRTIVMCVEHRCVHYRYVGEGQPCQLGPSATLSCDAGLFCDSDLSGDPPWGGTCKAGTPIGQTCDPKATIDHCGMGNFCDPVTQTCAANKATGESCTSNNQCQAYDCENAQCVSYVANEGVCWKCAPEKVTNATGACDPIDQNCPPGHTCTISGGQLACAPHAGTGKLFDACSTDDDCGTGLLCGNQRCTRPCCSALERVQCGNQGKCQLRMSFDPSLTLEVCTFAPSCDPWTGSCSQYPESVCVGQHPTCSFPIGTSPTIDQPCQYVNDCDDSQVCWTHSQVTQCRWLCKYSDTGAPTTGKVGGEPGKGGCASGQTCQRFSDSTWLGVCVPSA